METVFSIILLIDIVIYLIVDFSPVKSRGSFYRSALNLTTIIDSYSSQKEKKAIEAKDRTEL